MTPSYGKVIETMSTEGLTVTQTTGYRDGAPVHKIRRTEESIAVSNRQELFDHILHELTKLDDCDQVQFTVIADRQTRQPARVVVVNEEKL